MYFAQYQKSVVCCNWTQTHQTLYIGAYTNICVHFIHFLWTYMYLCAGMEMGGVARARDADHFTVACGDYFNENPIADTERNVII